MTFRKDVPSFIKVVLAGIAAGSLCAALDLIPPDNVWTFSSFSGSLGFWAVTGMLILMQSEKRILAGVNVFLYFAFMNAAFFFVHLALPFEFPRIAALEEAVGQSLVWLIPSFACGLCALIAWEAQRDDLRGTIALSLPCGLLLAESVSLYLSVFCNHKYLFQAIVDTIGLILLVLLYRKKKRGVLLAAFIAAVAALILLVRLTLYHNILYY